MSNAIVPTVIIIVMVYTIKSGQNHRPDHSNGTAQNTLAKQSFIMVNGSTRGTMLKYSMPVYGVK